MFENLEDHKKNYVSAVSKGINNNARRKAVSFFCRSLKSSSVWILLSKNKGASVYVFEDISDSKNGILKSLKSRKEKDEADEFVPITREYFILEEKDKIPVYEEPPKKDELWTEPDYQNLKDNGEPISVIYWKKSIRDFLPDRPFSPQSYDTFSRLVTSLKCDTDNIHSEEKMFDIRKWMLDHDYATPKKDEYIPDVEVCNENRYALNNLDYLDVVPSDKLIGTGIDEIPDIPTSAKELNSLAGMDRFLGAKPDPELLNAAKMAAKVIPFMFENDGEDLDTKPVRTAKHRYKTKTHRKNLTVKDGQEAIEKVNKKKQIQKESASHSKTQSKENKRHQQKGIS